MTSRSCLRWSTCSGCVLSQRTASLFRGGYRERWWSVRAEPPIIARAWTSGSRRHLGCVRRSRAWMCDSSGSGPRKTTGSVAATTRPHVEFVGEVAEPYPWLASFDVFTMPSRVDPFPLAVLEAMTLARPVIAFDIPGIRDQVGDAGVLVEAQDVDGFANAIVDLLGSVDLRVRLGTAARAHVDEEFGFDRFAALVCDQVATATMSSESAAPAPPARLRYEPVDEADTEVMLLHAFDDRALIASTDGAPLPYRVEQLTENGIALTLSAREHRRPWNRALVRRIVRFLERLSVPFLQVALACARDRNQRRDDRNVRKPGQRDGGPPHASRATVHQAAFRRRRVLVGERARACRTVPSRAVPLGLPVGRRPDLLLVQPGRHLRRSPRHGGRTPALASIRSRH